MPRILIVAYGNPLRSDDGVAWRAGDALESKFPPSEVEILRAHQLAPEIAEQACRSECVIFIDAAAILSSLPGEIRAEEIHSENLDHNDSTRFSHVVSPQAVIALAATLYDAKLKAILVTVTGENFEHGESLSPQVAPALPVLVACIEGIVRSLLREKA